MAFRPYPNADRARHQLDRGAKRPVVDAQREGVFAQACTDAAASIDRQFQWMPPRVVLREAAPTLDYEACRNLVDAVHRERHGLRRSRR